MSKIAVLGAAGHLGRIISAELARLAPEHELVLAGRDVAALSDLAEQIGPAKAVRVDVNDRDAAVSALEREHADVIVNCTTLLLFAEAFEIASRLGANYTDLGSALNASQDQQARAAGIAAVPGLGLTPGLSNVLVRHAADSMDVIEEVEILFVLHRAIASTHAVLNTTIWGFSEQTDGRGYFSNGRFRPVPPGDGSRTVEFPPPFGRVVTSLRPHPEARDLPQSFKTLRHCAVRAAYPTEIENDMRVLNKYGLLHPDFVETARAAIWRSFGGKTLGRLEGTGAFRLEVVGVLDGRRSLRRYSVGVPKEGLYAYSGYCAAVGALLLARHGAATTGVLPPERYFDPTEYLAELDQQAIATVEWEDSPIEA